MVVFCMQLKDARSLPPQAQQAIRKHGSNGSD